jgi:hypothetical protein
MVALAARGYWKAAKAKNCPQGCVLSLPHKLSTLQWACREIRTDAGGARKESRGRYRFQLAVTVWFVVTP